MAQDPPAVTDLLQAVTAPQLWSIAVAFFALLGGTFAFGAFVQSLRDQAHALNSAREIQDLKRAIEALTQQVNVALDERDMLRTKSEFLNRLVSYLQGDNEMSKKLLVEVVSSMWEQSQKGRIKLDRRSVHLPLESLIQGDLTPDMFQLLESNGVPPELLERIKMNADMLTLPPEGVSTFKGDRFAQQSRFANLDAESAAVTVQKYARGEKFEIVKVITFADSTSYELPQEIAVAVHNFRSEVPNVRA